MTDMPRRRLLDRLSPPPSLLTHGSRVQGDIKTAGALLVSGEIIGDGQIGGELSISAQAHWQGNLRARSAVIAGRLTGSIVVADRIEIAASAVIIGGVTARRIAMARGAVIDGQVTVTGGEPIVEFDEQRSDDDAD